MLALIQIPYLLHKSDVLHLTSYIITKLHVIHFKILELLMLFHMRLHGIEAFCESQF